MDGAFLICGHGGEPRRTFIVPKGCIIIVHADYANTINRDEYLSMIQKLRILAPDILKNPLTREHLPKLLQIYQSIAAYQEGEECPDFGYQLFDCQSSTRCYNVPMGVINMMEPWNIPFSYGKESELAESATHKDIIEHFARPYTYSINPIKQEVEDKVKEIIQQNPPSLLRAIYKGVRDMTERTLSEVCVHKGVYYHTLCREKRDITKALRRHFTGMMTLEPDIKKRPIKHRPIKNIITLQKDIKQIERLPLSNSHTLKKKGNAIALKRGMIHALRSRIGETVKHRTPHIKQMMNSPAYQERRKKEVGKEITDINNLIKYYQTRLKEIKDAIEKKEKKERGINTPSDKLTTDMHTPIDTLKELERKFTRDIKRKEAMRKNLLEWVNSMDTPPVPPISYVQENKRWKSDSEVQHDSVKSNAESNALEHLNHVVYPARGSANEREQLQRMREAHARFKKGRNEYMEEANAQNSDYEKNMAYMTNEMKGYERGIKRLEYLTNVVPPFHTSRVKIDKNKQLQEMRNAHARFTTSRKNYMNSKVSNSHTTQYKKNMNYFNRVLRGYEKGIHQAENPSSYTRVNKNGTV